MPVKNGLLASAMGLSALVMAVGCQQAAPGELPELASPVTEAVEPAPVRNNTPKPRSVKEKNQACKETPAAPSAEPVAAPVFRPAEVATPFVPSVPGKRIARVNVPGPYVAVTFDDGPHAALTPQVLDIFNRHGAHATFFVQGQNATRNRNLLARAVAEGHEVGSHTWSHINMRASSREKIVSELDRTAAVIEEATGSRPKVMRPPYGSVNQPLVDMVYKRYGTPSIMWDVDTNDWRKPGVEIVVRRAVGQAKPGSIILLHDIHSSTVAAVEDIVTGLQARGFKLVTVSELIALGRNAAGASAPAREPEEPVAEAMSPAAEVPAAPVPQEPQCQQQPVGGASIGTAPAPAAAEVPAEQKTLSLPEETDVNFDES